MAEDKGIEDKGITADKGLGWLLIFTIPFVIGIAALVWFMFFRDIHDVNHAAKQEDRAAAYVGASEKPISKIKIVTQDRSCLKLNRVDVDGRQMLVYTTNACHKRLDYIEIHWSAISPDGTVILGGYVNNAMCAIPEMDGDKAECRIDIPEDDRVTSLRVWARPDVY